METPTVRIASDPSKKNPHGYVVINEADFDEGEHILWVDPATIPAALPEPKAKDEPAKFERKSK